MIGFWTLCVAMVAAAASTSPCPNQKARSAELVRLYRGDQKCRESLDMTPGKSLAQSKVAAMAREDLARRKRVAEIFAEGCLSTAADFAAAAMIYQHGTVPEHYLQAALWAKAAVERGDKNQKQMVAMATDRYLVNTGRNQLFATQAFRASDAEDACWCLQPVEESFPDELRVAYSSRVIAQAQVWVRSLNAGSAACADAAPFCKTALVATPRGSVPGIW